MLEKDVPSNRLVKMKVADMMVWGLGMQTFLGYGLWVSSKFWGWGGA